MEEIERLKANSIVKSKKVQLCWHLCPALNYKNPLRLPDNVQHLWSQLIHIKQAIIEYNGELCALRSKFNPYY